MPKYSFVFILMSLSLNIFLAILVMVQGGEQTKHDEVMKQGILGLYQNQLVLGKICKGQLI